MSFFGMKTNTPPEQQKPQEQRINDFANNLKDALMKAASTKKDDNSGYVIGVDLGSKQAFQSQVNDLIKSIKDSYKSYSNELGKAARIRELNKSLVSNFRNNLQVMVDVTQLLRSYIQLFDVMKKELARINELIGSDATNLEDIEYLKVLTEQHVKDLQGQFNDQSDFLQKHYDAFELSESKKKIGDTTSQIGSIMKTANDIVREEGKPAYGAYGGKKGRKAPKGSKKESSC